jgi:hypothetical protein
LKGVFPISSIFNDPLEPFRNKYEDIPNNIDRPEMYLENLRRMPQEILFELKKFQECKSFD